jgi:hypothetical protein
VTITDIRQDLVDGYRYVHANLNTDLREAGSKALIDASRCSYFGWSAGGGNVLYMVSIQTISYSDTWGFIACIND